MPISWKRIVESQKAYGESDFQRAAMRLVTEQILYQSNMRQRSDHDLVVAYEKEFAEALELLGCKLDVNPNYRYVAATPTQVEASKFTLNQTLLALVLASLYDHHMRSGTLRKGVAEVSIPELEAAFKESTRRDLPMRPQSELFDLLDVAKRWGIARAARSDEAEGAEWYVEILPGVTSLVTQNWIASLKAHAESLIDPLAVPLTAGGDRPADESDKEAI